MLPLVDALLEEDRQSLAGPSEVIEEALVLELSVVDLPHGLDHEVGRHAGGDQRSHNGARRGTGDAVDLIPVFDERQVGTDESDAFDATTFEDQVRV